MILREILLENVRQFERSSFSFRSGFNLIVGENGSGKSTILRSIFAALGDRQRRSLQPLLTDEDVRLKSNDFRITTVLLDGQRGTQALTYKKSLGRKASRSRGSPRPLVVFYASDEVAAQSLVSRKIRRYASGESGQARTTEEFLYESSKVPAGASTNPDSFGRSELVREFVASTLTAMSDRFEDFYWRFEPFECSVTFEPEFRTDPKFREIAKSLSHAIMRHLQEHTNPFAQLDQRLVTIDSAGFIINQPDQKQRETRPPERVIPSFREILSRYQEGRGSFSVLEKCVAEVGLTPRIVVRLAGGEFLLSQLSDGEQRMFSLFVDIGRRLSLADPLVSFQQVPAVILIDEIDIHLHPKWQRMIVPALEKLFPSCQFIATTHSPFVIQAVDRDKILTPSKPQSATLNPTANSIEDIAEDIQGIEMPQRSRRAEDLSKAAERYFWLLRQKNVSSQELEQAETEYRVASEPFATNPALEALLRVEQMEARRR